MYFRGFTKFGIKVFTANVLTIKTMGTGNCGVHFFSTFKLTKTSILPNCQVSNGNFLLVENYTNFNISGLLGDLERYVSPI